MIQYQPIYHQTHLALSCPGAHIARVKMDTLLSYLVFEVSGQVRPADDHHPLLEMNEILDWG